MLAETRLMFIGSFFVLNKGVHGKNTQKYIQVHFLKIQYFIIFRYFSEFTLDTICRLVLGQRESTLFENPRLQILKSVRTFRISVSVRMHDGNLFKPSSYADFSRPLRQFDYLSCRWHTANSTDTENYRQAGNDARGCKNANHEVR